MTFIIWVCAWPAMRRRCHASAESLATSLNIFGIVRVPGLPSAWHDMQPVVLIWFSHSGLVFMRSRAGNSLFAGILSIEYQ